jgi:hypothetical protein
MGLSKAEGVIFLRFGRPCDIDSLLSRVIEGNGDRVEIATYCLDDTDWTSALSVKQIISRVFFSL